MECHFVLEPLLSLPPRETHQRKAAKTKTGKEGGRLVLLLLFLLAVYCSIGLVLLLILVVRLFLLLLILLLFLRHLGIATTLGLLHFLPLLLLLLFLIAQQPLLLPL